jgi:hypothetical protein
MFDFEERKIEKFYKYLLSQREFHLNSLTSACPENITERKTKWYITDEIIREFDQMVLGKKP